MTGKAGLFKLVIGAALLALALPTAATALTDPSQDPRADMPVRPGTIVESLYGPFNIPAASGGSPGQIHNSITSISAPCTNCRITDMVPDLVRTSSPNQTANIQEGLMLHHFLIKDTGKPDIVCPSGFQGQGGIRAFAAGNERTHLHLPSNFGYTPASSSWLLVSHLLNFNAVPEPVYIKVSWRYRPLDQTRNVTPAWLDVDGCNDAEYTVPNNAYSDTHVAPPGPNTNTDWTSTLSGHIVALSGHSHDITVDLNPSCTIQCMNKGGGIAVSAEVMGGPASTYYGPNPVTNPFLSFGPVYPAAGHSGPRDGSGNAIEPTDLAGATLCRSEAKYGTATGNTLHYNGHLDTMTACGVFTDVPVGAQPEAYPAAGAYSVEGYPITAGQVIRLHSEYYNNTGAAKTNVMGIMIPWIEENPTYERPQSGSPISTSLVPVFKQCGTGANPANGAHSAPFSGPSCTSLGTNAVAHMGSQSVNTAGLTVVPGNVNLTASLTDIRATNPTGPDYDPGGASPELTLVAKWRVTDTTNGTTTQTGAGTGTDQDFPVPVNCTATGGPEGSNCNASTSANALVPGSIAAGKATLISVFRVRVNDSGADGIRGNGDDKLFAQEGYFVP